jgi:hypothetical protein
MKQIKKIVASIIVIAATISTANAQSTATSSATATIVTPISIVKNIDMNFGNIAVTNNGGNVILAAAGTRTATGGVTLPAVAGTVSAAAFTVSGQSGYTYDITLPSGNIVLSSGANSMNINTFTSSVGLTAGALSTGSTGSQSFTVGATINVNANQAAGTYTTSTPFNVTVNYN